MADYKEGLHLLPDYMQEGMVNWIEKGWLPGGFLTAILSNNFMEAAGRADSTNQLILHNYAKYLYNYAPPACFGSPVKVSNWYDAGGIEGNSKTERGDY